MYRIGIIGTENSHALAFAKIINLPDAITGKKLYPDAKVVGVYGPDTETAQKTANEAGIDFIASAPDELLDRVDAMFITNRKGSLHYKYALPFIEKGMAVFVDKPFTVDLDQAEALVKAAEKSGAILSGGSGCKLAWDVLLLKNSVGNLTASGKMITASINFAADPGSEYDGFFFYASHLTEMALTIFGNDLKSLVAFEKNGSRICIWRYEDFDVTLNYTKGSSDSTCIIFAKDRNIVRNIDLSLIYSHEVEEFINTLRTGKANISPEDLIRPVRIINAIEESVKTGKEIYF